jgi:hypothetical protein
VPGANRREPASAESRCLRVQRKVGGKFHLKLNISRRPIANKYREGKMKRTLKRGLKVLEIAEREAVGPNTSDQPVPGDPRLEGSQHQFARGGPRRGGGTGALLRRPTPCLTLRLCPAPD